MTHPASANDFPLKGILLPTQSLIPSRPKRSLRGRHQNSALGQEIQKSICIFVLVYSRAVDTPASLVIQS